MKIPLKLRQIGIFTADRLENSNDSITKPGADWPCWKNDGIELFSAFYGDCYLDTLRITLQRCIILNTPTCSFVTFMVMLLQLPN